MRVDRTHSTDGLRVTVPAQATRPAVGLSVVMPVRGGSATALGEALGALVGQECPVPWELVIADNGMSGGVTRLVDSARALFPALRVVDATGRPGRSSALNRGVEAARADLLVFLDADDIAAPGYLAAMYRALQRSDFAGARLNSAALNPAWLQRRRTPLQEQRLDHIHADRPAVIGASMAVRRSALEAVGGFAEDLPSLEDLDVSWRLFESGTVPAFVPDALLCYRYRDTVGGIFAQERSYGRAEAMLYERHRGTAMRPRRARSTVRGWFEVLAAVPSAGNRAGQARLATAAGAAVGRLEGSLRQKVLYL